MRLSPMSAARCESRKFPRRLVGTVPDMAEKPRVVIVGSGFAGLTAQHRLAKSGMAVTLVDRNVYGTFQPLLYQVATAGLTSADVAYPAWTAAHKTRTEFRKGEVVGIDTAT